MIALPGSGIRRISRCVLETGPRSWQFARDNATAIDAHWQRTIAANPALFNGIIHMVYAAEIAADTLRTTLLRTEFKNYLFWRASGFPEAGVRDGFGSALIRSVDGHVVLGRQRHGNVNGGMAYLPGGFIDPRDVAPAGTIDIDASIRREIGEETGFGAADFELSPGYILTFSGALISIAREHRSRLDADTIRARILQHIAGDPQSELSDAVIVRSAGDLEGLAMAPYARSLLGWLFAEQENRSQKSETRNQKATDF